VWRIIPLQHLCFLLTLGSRLIVLLASLLGARRTLESTILRPTTVLASLLGGLLTLEGTVATLVMRQDTLFALLGGRFGAFNVPLGTLERSVSILLAPLGLLFLLFGAFSDLLATLDSILAGRNVWLLLDDELLAPLLLKRLLPEPLLLIVHFADFGRDLELNTLLESGTIPSPSCAFAFKALEGDSLFLTADMTELVLLVDQIFSGQELPLKESAIFEGLVIALAVPLLVLIIRSRVKNCLT
jgi:hypothetical protein